VRRWRGPACFQALGYEVVAFGKVSHYGHVQAYGFDHAAYFNYHQDVCVDKAVEWLAARKSGKPPCLLVGTNFPHVPWPDFPAAAQLDHWKSPDSRRVRECDSDAPPAAKLPDTSLDRQPNAGPFIADTKLPQGGMLTNALWRESRGLERIELHWKVEHEPTST
jgi:hypothetical protein